MATLDVVTTGNQKAGSIDLDPAIFEAPVQPHLFHAEVRRQLAKRRSGTHSTKNRAAVSGGGIKPWKQKGTGRARQGTIRAPQWAGGGVVFGPVPRSYEHALPKKVRRAALRGALSHQLRGGRHQGGRRARARRIQDEAGREAPGATCRSRTRRVLIVIAAEDRLPGALGAQPART